MDFTGTARDLGRLTEIAVVLARYGFADVARRLGMENALERAGKALQWASPAGLVHLDTPQRVRHVLQDLGPTFVKLGQLLSTRVDLLSQELISELEKLQDQAPATPWDEVRDQLVEDLHADPESVFHEFDVTPLAAGSIAQVHRARLADGTLLAVKVRRPGIVSTVEADLSLLAHLASLVEARFPDLARFQPRAVVRRLMRTMRAELDLAAECRNAERVAQAFRDDDTVVVPKIYWEWTGKRVNVQEYVEGVPGRDLPAADRAGLDRKTLAHRGAQAMLKMVIEDGFFHADPHPGNLFYLPGNRIALIDFGMTGRLSAIRRDELVILLNSLVNRDAEGAVEILLAWADAPSDDIAALIEDIEAFIDRYHGVPLRELRMEAIFADLARLLREHKLALPPDLALVLKVGVTLEKTGRQLDEDFDLVAEAEPFLRAAAFERRGLTALVRRGRRAATVILELLAELPLDMRRIVRLARSGRLQVHVNVTALAGFGAQLDRAASRLTVGIVTAAFIIGSSIVMTVEGGPTVLGLPFVGLAGFLGAISGGVWLLYSIWRSGRTK